MKVKILLLLIKVSLIYLANLFILLKKDFDKNCNKYNSQLWFGFV